MKIFISSIFCAILLANTAIAFSLPSSVSVDPKETKLKTCMLQEAQQALAKGEITKDNIESQAVKISTSCATKSAMKSDNITVQLATTIIKGLLK